MIQRADTLGVFQIESRAQMSMLPRSGRRNSTISSSRWRSSGPARSRGNMVHPYLRRREGKEKPEYPKPELKEELEEDLWRAALPGAGDEGGDRGRALHAGRGGRAAALHGHVQIHRRRQQIPDEDDRGDGGQWLYPRLRRADLQADRGLRLIRLSGEPCGELRQDRLCLLLGEASSPGDILLRAAQRPAHGFLRAGPDRPRCARPWRDGAPRLHQ